MNYKALDSKLKTLIQLCKDTHNHKKLAVVSFVLTNNLLNEICMKLGIHPRSNHNNTRLFEYMNTVNSIFWRNLKIRIFQEKMIDEIKECEDLFFRNSGNMPFKYIKKMYKIYYDLRDLEVPNLYKNIDTDTFLTTPSLSLFPYLFRGRDGKTKDSSKLRPLILQKIKEQELLLQKELNRSFDKNKFETALYLKDIKNALYNNKRGKISVKGSLKDNIIYQNSQKDMMKYFVLGFLIFFLASGVVILIEIFYYPEVTTLLSPFLLCTLLPFIILFLLYNYYFKKEG